MAEIDESEVVVENSRITKLREYLVGILEEMLEGDDFQVNADMLSKDPNNYSLDKMPIEREVERWTIGICLYRDVFSFRSRMNYSQDTYNNLLNIGFFEEFEARIKEKSKEGNLPDIEGIEAVRCLNCGTQNNATTDTAEFDIQIQIEYRR